MNLMDTPIPPGSFDGLAEPLIDAPVDLSSLEDVYMVGKSPSKRWRVYIDFEKWDPSNYNTSLVKAKAYHARVLYEACYLLSFTDSTWLSTATYELIKATAHLELRRVEFEILSFQLTAGMVGIWIEKGKTENLYHCATTLFTTLMWMSKRMNDITGDKRDKETFYGLVDLKPFPSDSSKQLGKNVDRLIFAIFSFLKHKGFKVSSQHFPEEMVRELGNKLQTCIIKLDTLIKVVD